VPTSNVNDILPPPRLILVDISVTPGVFLTARSNGSIITDSISSGAAARHPELILICGCWILGTN